MRKAPDYLSSYTTIGFTGLADLEYLCAYSDANQVDEVDFEPDWESQVTGQILIINRLTTLHSRRWIQKVNP